MNQPSRRGKPEFRPAAQFHKSPALPCHAGRSGHMAEMTAPVKSGTWNGRSIPDSGPSDDVPALTGFSIP